MSVHFKILSGILTLLTGKPSFMNMKNPDQEQRRLVCTHGQRCVLAQP